MSKKNIAVIAAVAVVIIAAIAVIVATTSKKNNEEITSENTTETTTEAPTDESTTEEVTTEDTTEEDTDEEETESTKEVTKESTEQLAEGEISVEEARKMLEDKYGTEDVDTGYPYSYGYDSKVTIDGQDYYNFRMTWLVDNDHMSYLTNMFVATDGSAIYSGASDGNGGWELEID